ncbi:hypothetical protein [Fodinicurvata sp. EGI_FJ10296]|uniref:hypothetical protein n=1 Tax=Fodinicurvata sp. EGI_FJ10296 TaxID=3231908 RepID=UPI0034572563
MVESVSRFWGAIVGVALAGVAGGMTGAQAFAQDVSGVPIYGQTNLNAAFAGDPRTVDLTAGGTVNVRNTIGGSCTGYVANSPDYRVYYSAGGLPLSFYATSNTDTTLVVNAPDGRWYCNDDTRGVDPAVRFNQPQSGQYDIWVGTFGQISASARLHITELEPFGMESSGGGYGNSGGSGGYGAGGLDLSAAPIYGSLSLRSGFANDPRRQSLTAGGGNDASRLGYGPGCIGYVATAPDFQVDYSAGMMPLSFYVTSNTDTTLLVNAPNGRWYCNDDYRGVDPAVQFDQPMSGRYDIWVGTFNNSSAPATLHVSEFSPF